MKRIKRLEVSGSITGQATRDFRKNLEALCKTGAKVIAIDLSKVHYMESHGLGVLVHMWQEAKEKEVQLIVFNPQEFILELLTNTGLVSIMKIAKSEEELSTFLEETPS